MPLATRLDRAARIFSSAFESSQKRPTLVGGGAMGLHGSKRQTKDLDFDLAEQPTLTTLKQLRKCGISITQSPTRPDRLSANVPESRRGARDAVKIDIAIRPQTAMYAKRVLGITVARREFLLTAKLLIIPNRSRNALSKVKHDMDDVQFLCEKVKHEDHGVVASALRASCTSKDMRAFWKRVDREGHWNQKERERVKKLLKEFGFRER